MATKMVRYDFWCHYCKYKDTDDTEDPCNECMNYPVNEDSTKPICYQEKEKPEGIEKP